MEKQAGIIVILTKNEDHGVKVPLKTNTQCSFGSSLNATVRLKIDNKNLGGIHCVINVDSKGFAVLMNKSTSHPIVLNGKALLNKKVLINNDIFEVCGRRFQYVNSRMTEEKVKLYRNETGLHFKATTSKSTVTESVVSTAKTNTPARSTTTITSIKRKQSMSTTRKSKKLSPQCFNSMKKPKSNHSPMKTRRSLFKTKEISKTSTNTSKIPILNQPVSQQRNKVLNTPLKIRKRNRILPDTPAIKAPVSTSKNENSIQPISQKKEEVLDIPPKIRKRSKILPETPAIKTLFSTEKIENSEESSINDFLENEKLCKSLKKDRLRFVTVRNMRKKSRNLLFDSFSADEQTPSKRNVSGNDSLSKRKSVRRSSQKLREVDSNEIQPLASTNFSFNSLLADEETPSKINVSGSDVELTASTTRAIDEKEINASKRRTIIARNLTFHSFSDKKKTPSKDNVTVSTPNVAKSSTSKRRSLKNLSPSSVTKSQNDVSSSDELTPSKIDLSGNDIKLTASTPYVVNNKEESNISKRKSFKSNENLSVISFSAEEQTPSKSRSDNESTSQRLVKSLRNNKSSRNIEAQPSTSIKMSLSEEKKSINREDEGTSLSTDTNKKFNISVSISLKGSIQWKSEENIRLNNTEAKPFDTEILSSEKQTPSNESENKSRLGTNETNSNISLHKSGVCSESTNNLEENFEATPTMSRRKSNRNSLPSRITNKTQENISINNSKIKSSIGLSRKSTNTSSDNFKTEELSPINISSDISFSEKQTPLSNRSENTSVISHTRNSNISLRTSNVSTASSKHNSKIETKFATDNNTELSTSLRKSSRGFSRKSQKNTSLNNLETQSSLLDEKRTSSSESSQSKIVVETTPATASNISLRKSSRNLFRESSNASSDSLKTKEFSPVNVSSDTSFSEKHHQTPLSNRNESTLPVSPITNTRVSLRKSNTRTASSKRNTKIETSFVTNSNKKFSTLLRKSERSQENQNLNNFEMKASFSDEKLSESNENINVVETPATTSNISLRKSSRNLFRKSTNTSSDSLKTKEFSLVNISSDTSFSEKQTPLSYRNESTLPVSPTTNTKISLRKSNTKTASSKRNNKMETSFATDNNTEFSTSLRKSNRGFSRRSQESTSLNNLETEELFLDKEQKLSKSNENINVVLTPATASNISLRKSSRNLFCKSTNTSSDSLNTKEFSVGNIPLDTSFSEEQTPLNNRNKSTSIISLTRNSNISVRKSNVSTASSNHNSKIETTFATDNNKEYSTSLRKSGRALSRKSQENISLNNLETETPVSHEKQTLSESFESKNMVETTPATTSNISLRKSSRNLSRKSTNVSQRNSNSNDSLLTEKQKPLKNDSSFKTTPSVRISRRSGTIKLKKDLSTTDNDFKKKQNSVNSSLRRRRVRAKSLTVQLKPKSTKKRCSLNILSRNDPQEDTDVTTPVMTHNISKNCLSAPRIHHMRISRLDDAVNESLHMDDSGLETPVIHETSRRSLMKKSAKLQESLGLISPEKSLKIDENERITPDIQETLSSDIFNTPLKTNKSSSSARKFSNMKETITSTPKEEAPSRGLKRQLSTSLEEINLKKRRKVKNDDSPEENSQNFIKKNKSQNTLRCSYSSSKKVQHNVTGQENLTNEENSLLESTVASSIIYETNLSNSKVRTPLSEKKELQKTPSNSENIKTPKSDTSNISGIASLYVSPQPSTSKSTDINTALENVTSEHKLRNVSGAKKQTIREIKSPLNDLRNIHGLRKIFQTPKQKKSPRNDLRNVGGIKRLLRTPKIMKSPQNDLTNVRGVKKLMQTPQQIKSPENDLRNVGGLRRLMQTPKEMKSPDLRGVKKLMQSPQQIKSPENDLRNVGGLRRLMQTPKEIKSPKNDLSNVSGVKRLMQKYKGPRNDLLNVSGVRDLFEREESAFDKLVQKKKIITYKARKSSSETNKKSLSPSSCESTSSYVKPEVEKWVSQQIELKSIELEQSSAKKRVARKARKDDFSEPITVTTKRSTRQRKVVEEEPIQEEKKEARMTRRNLKQNETPSKRNTRQRKVVEEEPVQETKKESKQNDESTQIQAEGVRRTRRQNKKQTNEEVKKNENSCIQLRTRSRKQNTKQQENINNSVESSNSTKSKRRHKNEEETNDSITIGKSQEKSDNSVEIASTKNKKRRKNKEATNDSIATDISSQEKTKRTRQNRGKTGTEAMKTSEETVETMESQTRITRSSKKAVVEYISLPPRKRSRK